jgi:predicted nuclease of restriction endonuclease-like RecB superfamily
MSDFSFDDVDVSETQDRELTLLPEAQYLVMMDNVEFDPEYITHSSKVLSPRISITWRIAKGDMENRKCWTNFYLQEKTIKYVLQDLQRMGLLADVKAKCKDLHFVTLGRAIQKVVTPMLDEAQFYIKIVHKEFGGKVRENVQIQRPFNEAPQTNAAAKSNGKDVNEFFDADEEVPF